MDIEKPEVDCREYRSFVLPNQLKAIVVHDPECLAGARNAAGALILTVGKLHEPKDIPGMAHFCEHMLFLANEKYPKESDYKKFAKKNGGHTNASTNYQHTGYYFEIAASKLELILDRFCNYFISPIIRKSAVDREVNAVNSEHDMKYTDDERRLISALLLDVNEKHPLHWGSGNLKTLKYDLEAQGRDLHQELIKFYEHSYSANLMTLCVLGGDSLDELEALVTEKFSPIVNKNIVVNYGEDLEKEIGVEAISREAFTGMLYYAPFKEQRSIRFEFLLPWQQMSWRTKAVDFLLFFLSHEGSGSIVSLLQKEGLISSLSASCSDSFGCFSKLSIAVTVPSSDHVDPPSVERIGSVIFTYIDLININLEKDEETAVMKEYWEEMKAMREVNFRFKSSTDPFDFAKCLVRRCKFLDPNDFSKAMSLNSKFFEYDLEAIKAIVSLLSPENLRLILIDKKFADKCVNEDPWHGGKTFKQPIKARTLDIWSKETNAGSLRLSLPEKNRFIAQDFSLRDNKMDIAQLKTFLDDPTIVPSSNAIGKEFPVKIKTDTNICHSFWRPDYKFFQPKASLKVKFYLPFVSHSAKTMMLARLWCSCVLEELNERLYPAFNAGLSVNLFTHLNGIVISFSGFNDKLPVLVQTVLDEIEKFKTKPFSTEIFISVFQKLKDNMKNVAGKQKPYHLAAQQSTLLLTKPLFSAVDRNDALQDLKKEMVDSLNHYLFRDCFFESLCTGNMGIDEYAELIQNITNQFKEYSSEKSDIPVISELQLPPETTFLKVFEGIDPEEANICAREMIQLERTLENSCFAKIFMQAFAIDYRVSLRTKQQLGYNVKARYSVRDEFGYIVLFIQSQHPPEYVFQRIRAFYTQFVEETVFSEEFAHEFRTFVDAVLSNFHKEPRSISILFKQDWETISERRYDFQRNEHQIRFVENITIEDFRQWISDVLQKAPNLLVEVRSLKETESKDLIRQKLSETDLETLPSNRDIKSVEERDKFKDECRWISRNAQKKYSPRTI